MEKIIEKAVMYGLSSLVVVSLITLIYHVVIQSNYPTSFGIYG